MVVGWRRAGWSFRLRLHSGLRQSGRGPLRARGFLGLRPRLVYVGPLALGLVVGLLGLNLGRLVFVSHS